MALLAGCGDTSDPPSEHPAALHAPSLTVVADEVWVHGGLAAPVGTSPPVTSLIPPGWGPNHVVARHSSRGAVVQLIRLPAMENPIGFSRVLADRDRRFLLGSTCRGAGGCGRETEPVLLRLEEPVAEEVRLELPPATFGDDVGAELLWPLGSADGAGFTLQGLGDRGVGYAGRADRHRLLAIDLETGVGTEVPLPAGIYGEQLVCMAGARIFAVQADVTAHGEVQAARIYSMDARNLVGDWVLLAEIPIAPTKATHGQLGCLEGTRELLVSVQGSEAEVLTLSMTDGRETAPRLILPLPPERASPLGASDVEAVLVTGDGHRAVMRRAGDAPWAVDPDVVLSPSSWPILVDGVLRDAARLRERLHLDGTTLPEVPGWRSTRG
jgi:hypothetical protein